MNHGGTEARSRSIGNLDDLYDQLRQLTRLESMRLGPPTIMIIGDKIEIVPQQPSLQFQAYRDYILGLIAKHCSIPTHYCAEPYRCNRCGCQIPPGNKGRCCNIGGAS